MVIRGALVLGIVFASVGCAGPRALPGLAVTPPVEIAIKSPPGLAPPAVALSWDALADDISIASVGVMCGGVFFNAGPHDDLAGYRIWQVDAVVQQGARNEFEALYLRPRRNLPSPVFELKRTQ